MPSLRDFFPGKKFIFIAEIGLNHNGDYSTACELIKKAAEAGADAVKFQTIVPEKLNSVYTTSLMKYGEERDPDFSSIKFFKKFILLRENYISLNSLSKSLKLQFFSAPFDNESVDLLEDVGIKFYKIASSEVTNHILLRRIAETKKPVIMSTGISSEEEISMAIELLRKNGTPDIVLLHCVSLYPLPPESANLKKIISLKNKFDVETGFSDHSGDIKACEAASALGACVFEKHFKLHSGFDCPDKDVSASPEEFKKMIVSIKNIDLMKGSGKIDAGGPELETAMAARKSLFASHDIIKGTKLSPEDIIPKRPGTGIPVYELEKLLGRTANRDIKKDYQIRYEYFD